MPLRFWPIASNGIVLTLSTSSVAEDAELREASAFGGRDHEIVALPLQRSRRRVGCEGERDALLPGDQTGALQAGAQTALEQRLDRLLIGVVDAVSDADDALGLDLEIHRGDDRLPGFVVHETDIGHLADLQSVHRDLRTPGDAPQRTRKVRYGHDCPRVRGGIGGLPDRQTAERHAFRVPHGPGRMPALA